MELLADVRADLVTAVVNTRTDSSANILRICAEVVLHFADSFLNDAFDGATPAGMKNTNCPPLGVNKNNGDAIGSENAKQNGRRAGNHAIARERMLGCTANGVNDIRMNLAKRDKGPGVSVTGKLFEEAISIALDGNAIVIGGKTQVQCVATVRAGIASRASAETVNQPSNVL